MMKLSNRLLSVASFVTSGNRLADVGTDHGYIPIYLMQEGRIPSAIAMDINAGPLERAKEHIEQYGLNDYIETRLSDGVAALSKEEVDSILIAGMGGGLVLHILEAGEEVCQSAKELILQPQSELERVRAWLNIHGYAILEENMVFEDEKYYPMMRVSYQGTCNEEYAMNTLYCRYGKALLESKNPVLKQYLEKEKQQYTDIYQGMKQSPITDRVQNRMSEVGEILRVNREALEFFE